MTETRRFSTALIDRLRSAEAVAVLTGAGISAESGVPTFRGQDGLWKKYRPEELANFDAFMRNPTLVWEWYNYRRELISEVDPNPGHYALAQLEKMCDTFTLITQNVDGLHQRAGSKRVLELHGNITKNRCVSCSKTDGVSRTIDDLPHCDCGGLLRPDVVWFGESLPQKELELAFDTASRSTVFLNIGTSGVVQPAASLSLVARRNGAYVCEINIEETVLSGQMDETILGPSGEIMPHLVELLKKNRM
ncbi:MAG: NAD-dependent deacylase [Gemmatimonadota bacterium]|nr:MAG: NAD-dependent deacylase [Gemmatimonadota bacterium]